MKYTEIKNRFNELEYLNLGIIKDINLSKMTYKELNKLKNEVLSSYLRFDSIQEYEEAETLKLRIIEEILLCKMNIRESKRLSIDGALADLEMFYKQNGSIYLS